MSNESMICKEIESLCPSKIDSHISLKRASSAISFGPLAGGIKKGKTKIYKMKKKRDRGIKLCVRMSRHN
jgi:hypothetical protein